MVTNATACTPSAVAAYSGAGNPDKISPWNGGTGCDLTTGDCITPSGPCPSGNCYYTSWLFN